MSEKPKPKNIFEDILGKSAFDLGDLFTPLFTPRVRVVACPVCGVKNRLKPGGMFPKCGRCKTRLTC